MTANTVLQHVFSSKGQKIREFFMLFCQFIYGTVNLSIGFVRIINTKMNAATMFLPIILGVSK